MKAEQLKELGFKLVDEYVHGDNDEFVTKLFEKQSISVEFDYENHKLIKVEVEVSNHISKGLSLTIEELKQLDKILNK